MFLAGALDAGYYSSVPVPATAVAVSPPFTIQPAGARPRPHHGRGELLRDSQLVQSSRAGSPLQVAETDTTGKAETLFASGSGICGGALCGGGASFDIPTMSEWALIAMSVLLLLVGAVFLRNRSSRRPVA